MVVLRNGAEVFREGRFAGKNMKMIGVLVSEAGGRMASFFFTFQYSDVVFL